MGFYTNSNHLGASSSAEDGGSEGAFSFSTLLFYLVRICDAENGNPPPLVTTWSRRLDDEPIFAFFRHIDTDEFVEFLELFISEFCRINSLQVLRK